MTKREIAARVCEAEGGLLPGTRGPSAPYLQELGLPTVRLLAPGNHLLWEEVLQKDTDRQAEGQLWKGKSTRLPQGCQA